MVLTGERVLVLVEGPRGGALEDKMEIEMLVQLVVMGNVWQEGVGSR
jgi:hypothetical protein